MSKHCNIKPPEPTKQPKCEDKDEVVVVRAPIKESMERPPVDSAMTEVQATVAPALKDLIDNTETTKITSTSVSSNSK